MQAVKAQRIFARADDPAHILIDVARIALQKHARRLYGERAVNVDGEAVVTFYEAAIFYLADKIQHLLRPADGKRRDNDIAAAVERALDAGGKRGDVVRPLVGVVAVAVGGFNDEIIGFIDMLRVAEYGLIEVSDVT